jgi:para-aminobenzoate synthetase component I
MSNTCKIKYFYGKGMQHWVDLCNSYGATHLPFVVFCDFGLQQVNVLPIQDLQSEGVQIHFPTYTNSNAPQVKSAQQLTATAIDINTFAKAYAVVQRELQFGNTFLCNLTASTNLGRDLDLHTIYLQVASKYKILYQNKWVCFSPEQFVAIKDGQISTYPMKGTIDASISNAEQIILNDAKETAEHFTIVDLMRNDLGMVSSNVRVEQFRYIDHIRTAATELLQVSSKIVGDIGQDWHGKIGTILQQLLPAGSISGAPKKKTLDIIHEAEQLLTHERGFYTGVAAYYDGTCLDSCVLIRFIERKADGSFIYKSGGGITTQSTMQQEYDELNQKIYLPKA